MRVFKYAKLEKILTYLIGRKKLIFLHRNLSTSNVVSGHNLITRVESIDRSIAVGLVKELV